MPLLSRILKSYKCQDFLIALMSMLSCISQVRFRLYRVQKTRMEEANLPMMIPATEEEIHSICSEIAAEIYQGYHAIPHPLVAKRAAHHLVLGNSPAADFRLENKQNVYRLYPVAALWRWLQQSDHLGNDLQKSNEIIQEIQYAHSKLQSNEELLGEVLYENGANLSNKVLLKAQGQHRLERHIERCLSTCPYSTANNPANQPKTNGTGVGSIW